MKQHNLLYRSLCGLVTIEDFEADSVPIFRNPDYVPGTSIVVDAQRVMGFNFGFTEMRNFVQRTVLRLEARNAAVNILFVGDRLIGNSIASMFKCFTDIQETLISVYTDFDLEEVFAYLDLPSSIVNKLTTCRMSADVVCPEGSPCCLTRELGRMF
ncbi:MAG: hypothetical protein JJ868_19785 [Shimia sp.]|uniref:hypothetical protein n=1 Tax=Shimia sp. TaxID=1954381 RepID=UPI001B1E472C|nr:hypothetical protein [Shimia sp.]MBO6899605.1 hypothetical protein [Shimia sp.]